MKDPFGKRPVLMAACACAVIAVTVVAYTVSVIWITTK